MAGFTIGNRQSAIGNDEALVVALESQVELYRKLAKLAELQHVHVQQEQTESLLEVLMQRQRVLDALGNLERVVSPVRKEWTTFVGRLGAALRPRAESAMNQSRKLLEAITSADRNDAMVLQQRKLNLGKQINQTRAAKQVNRTYATAAYGQRTAVLDIKE